MKQIAPALLGVATAQYSSTVRFVEVGFGNGKIRPNSSAFGANYID
jgi:hypothetical protein